MKVLTHAFLIFALGTMASYALRTRKAEAWGSPRAAEARTVGFETPPPPFEPGATADDARGERPAKSPYRRIRAVVKQAGTILSPRPLSEREVKPGDSRQKQDWSIPGRLSATESRARDDARRMLERELSEWLGPEIPASWKPPARLVDAMIIRTSVHPVVKEYGTLYEATLVGRFSAERRNAFLSEYEHQLIERRIEILAGVFAFVLACLAAIAGYIRADEATRGYYTRWLGTAAVAGVGATAVVLYQLLT